MSDLLKEHEKLRKLVELGVLIPGIYDGKVGEITYQPISIEEYKKRVENGFIQGLSYNTRTMGRGIFTLGNEGKIINFKGIDSQLENSNSIAVQFAEGEIENINNKESYGINITHFIDRNNENPDGKKRLEFRIKGASQYQNTLVEKLKRDFIEENDNRNLVKLPEFDMPTPLSEQMCEKFGLPKSQALTQEFIEGLEEGSYAKYCIDQLEQKGIKFENRNQLWIEFFQEKYPEKLSDENLVATINKEDSTYGLGAIFAQTTRKLDNPFRIMELKYYLDNGNDDIVKAIMDYSIDKGGEDFLENYCQTSAKNVAGFMNLNLAMSNFEHRQDYPLSGEICDDAFDEINTSDYMREIYENQVYIFVTNVKIMEDAYKRCGRGVPENLQETFLKTFYESLQNKENFKLCFREPNPMERIKNFPNAEKNFLGMEEYVKNLREKAVELYKENYMNNSRDVSDDNEEPDL